MSLGPKNRRIGPRLGTGPAQGGFSLATVTQDATSLKYVPATMGEWTQVLGVSGVSRSAPKSIWLCQEAAGSLADSGSGGVTLSVTGTPGFQTVKAGWTRKFINYPVSTTARHTNTTTAPDAGSKSLLLLAWVFPPPADVGLVRGMLQIGTTVEIGRAHV